MTTTRIVQILTKQRALVASGRGRSFEDRARHLEILEDLVRANMDRIYEALFLDLHKPQFESYSSEVALVLEEIRMARHRLKKWMKPHRVKSPLHLWPAQSSIHYEPLGVILIISPWNYPFQLAMAPLVGALAAGNSVVVKPSEMAMHTSALIADLLNKAFSEEVLAVVEGGIAETTEILQYRFDHIFFTGSTRVGQVVMKAAAEHLTPVTLELGGKSPAIICADADLKLAARRTVWGKFLNSGQTCITPDYLFVEESVAAPFMELMKNQIVRFFGADARQSASYARIIDQRHFQRLRDLIEPSKVYFGGGSDESDLFIEPTILSDVTWQDPVMAEEIFGPILPVMTFREYTTVLREIQSRERPLAAYLFTRDKVREARFLNELSFGGGCINDTVLQITNPNLPFGGVGASGMSAYHGEKSFQIFSHAKSVVRKSRFFDFSFRYPPYTKRKLKLLKRFMG